jgi:hypothetical protein
VTGATYDYVGVYFSADLVTPTNSSYFYRLPGPDGACNTPDDVIHRAKTGMASTDSPIVASAMPIATVRTAQGVISGFVVKSGASLVLVRSRTHLQLGCTRARNQSARRTRESDLHNQIAVHVRRTDDHVGH